MTSSEFPAAWSSRSTPSLARRCTLPRAIDRMTGQSSLIFPTRRAFFQTALVAFLPSPVGDSSRVALPCEFPLPRLRELLFPGGLQVAPAPDSGGIHVLASSRDSAQNK